jgi:prepilin-type N-terminal cleavage/methylation domain-containing protein
MNSSAQRRTGFTLVEIAIVAALISMLALIAIPAFMRARRESQNARFISDLRAAVGAFEMYTLANNQYPPDVTPGVVPAGMAGYLAKIPWTRNTPIGGQWDWDNGQFGFTAGVSVYFGNAMEDARMTGIDAKIDDGSLSTGRFRKRSDGYIYVIEF